MSTHTCGLVDRIETEACGIQGTWRQWNQWSFCSSSCLGGTRVSVHIYLLLRLLDRSFSPALVHFCLFTVDEKQSPSLAVSVGTADYSK